MKKICSMVCMACITLLLFCGCCLTYSFESEGNMDFGYSKIERNAYIAICTVSCKEKAEIFIPDEYKGYPVTELGGYFGRGVPCPFGVDIVDKNEPFHEQEGEEYGEDFIVYVHIGKNIRKAKYLSCTDEFFRSEDGAAHHVVFYFIVSEDNAFFTSENGVLYDRATNAPVPKIDYASGSSVLPD